MTLNDALDAAFVDAQAVSTRARTVSAIAELLERSGLSVDDVGSVEKVRLYQGFYKDNEGVEHKVDMSSVLLNPAWADGPKWPVVQQAAPTTVKGVKVCKPVRGRFKTCLVLPDPQIGYRRDLVTGEMDPFHDERAMGVAMEVLRGLQPDLVINLGDTLDLAEMSSFRKEAGFALTTQATIDRAHLWLAEQRANAPHAEIRVIEGNHDRRLLNYITDNAKAAYGLRQANAPDSWPVLSVPFLLRLEELDVSYVEGYPAGITWINDRLACIHGERLKTDQVVDEERVSVIQGHTHHATRSSKTRRVAAGARTSLAVSPGCLCRIDGAVPSTKGSTDSRGRAIMRPEDWQQAVAVVRYEEGDGMFAVTIHDIINGWCMVDGVEYAA